MFICAARKWLIGDYWNKSHYCCAYKRSYCYKCPNVFLHCEEIFATKCKSNHYQAANTEFSRWKHSTRVSWTPLKTNKYIMKWHRGATNGDKITTFGLTMPFRTTEPNGKTRFGYSVCDYWQFAEHFLKTSKSVSSPQGKESPLTHMHTWKKHQMTLCLMVWRLLFYMV